MKVPRRIATLLLLASIALLVGAGVVAARHQKLVSEGAAVTGTVTSIERSTDSDGDTTYAPIYSYEHAGTRYTHKPGTTTSSRPAVGSTETLYVDRADPSHAMADTFTDRWFGIVMLAGFGVAGFVASIVIFKVTGAMRGAVQRRDVLRPTTLEAPRTATRANDAADSASAASAGNAGPFITGRERPDPRGPFV
jgi:hypothetical protein